MKRMWAPEELVNLTASYVDTNVNIKYEIVSDTPTWTIGALKIEDSTYYITFDSTKQFYFRRPVRFASTIYDSDNNVGSVKRIYCHPIVIYSGSEYNFTLLIFNNSVTAFTKTTLIDLLKELTDARFMVNGSAIINSKTVVGSYIRSTGTNLYLIGIGTDGVQHSEDSNQIDFEAMINNAAAFYDGVNAIN